MHALECVHEEKKTFLRALQGILALNQLPLAVQKFEFHRDLGHNPTRTVCHHTGIGAGSRLSQDAGGDF